MSSRSFFRRRDSQPRTPPRPSTSPAASAPYSPFRRQPLGRSEDLLPSTPESPSIGPASPNAPSSLRGNNRSLSCTWSVGTIPIVFDTSSPRPSAWNSGQQQLGTPTTDSPTFPSGVGSVSDSPGLNITPPALGYPSSPADNPASPLGEAPSSPSPTARKRTRWKGRFDLIEEATAATSSPEASGDSREDKVEQAQGAIVGLGVEAPGVSVLASPIVPAGSSPKARLSSRFRPRKYSTSFSPYASPDPSSLHPDDGLHPPRHSSYDHDDDDTTSLFSLSAYYATSGLNSPSFNDCDERFDQQHLHVPPGSSPALGPAISFDALPRLTTSVSNEPESDPFSATGTRHAREASGRTARPLGVTQTEGDQPPAGNVTTPSSTPPEASLDDVASKGRDLPSLESAPLSAFSETTESSRSYSSFSTSSVSTRPTEIAPSSSYEGSSESNGAINSYPQQTPFIKQSSSDAPPRHLTLQG
ncbi:hypothetical protein M407DRAFT_34031, partial [Tulasnella calospora MUT 4182]